MHEIASLRFWRHFRPPKSHLHWSKSSNHRAELTFPKPNYTSHHLKEDQKRCSPWRFHLEGKVSVEHMPADPLFHKNHVEQDGRKLEMPTKCSSHCLQLLQSSQSYLLSLGNSTFAKQKFRRGHSNLCLFQICTQRWHSTLPPHCETLQPWEQQHESRSPATVRLAMAVVYHAYGHYGRCDRWTCWTWTFETFGTSPAPSLPPLPTLPNPMDVQVHQVHQVHVTECHWWELSEIHRYVWYWVSDWPRRCKFLEATVLTTAGSKSKPRQWKQSPHCDEVKRCEMFASSHLPKFSTCVIYYVLISDVWFNRMYVLSCRHNPTEIWFTLKS